MTFAIPATVYNKKYNFIFIFFPTYLPNFSKKKSVNQLIKLEWPYSVDTVFSTRKKLTTCKSLVRCSTPVTTKLINCSLLLGCIFMYVFGFS